MPLQFTLPEKKVIFAAESLVILKLFEEALKNAGVKQASDERGAKSLAYLADPQNRPGLWPKFLRWTVERVTDEAHGSQYCLLPALSLEVETHAHLFLTKYQQFLNILLLSQGLSSQRIEQPEITCKYTLTAVLLVRLAALSLHQAVLWVTEGRQLLNALRDFETLLLTKNMLAVKRVFRSLKTSQFLSALAAAQDRWMLDMETAFSLVHVMNLHRSSVSQTLQHLGEAKLMIQRQLLVFLNYRKDTSAADLSPGLVSIRLNQLHQKLFARDFSDGVWIPLESDLVRSKISESLIRAHLLSLYEAWEKTHQVSQIVETLDRLITTTGWILIVNDYFNFGGLQNLLIDYATLCEAVLSLKQSVILLLRKSNENSLISCQAHMPGRLVRDLKEDARVLKTLDDHQLRHEISGEIYRALNTLIGLQEMLPSPQKFIKKDRLSLLGELMPQGLKTQGLRFEIYRTAKYPLHLAAQAGDLSFCQEFLRQGPDLDAQDASGQTALDLASQAGQLRVIELLKKGGARESQECQKQTQALQDLIAQLEPGGELSSEFFQQLHQHLKKGADIEAQDPRTGQTPLHQALISGHVRLIHWLIAMGASWGLKNATQEEPLFYLQRQRPMHVAATLKWVQTNYAHQFKWPVQMQASRSSIFKTWLGQFTLKTMLVQLVQACFKPRSPGNGFLYQSIGSGSIQESSFAGFTNGE